MDSHASVSSSNPPQHPSQRRPIPAAVAPAGTGVDNVITAPNTNSRLDTCNIPPQFLVGTSSSSSSSATRSSHGVLASNFSLKSELENIRLEDHCFRAEPERLDPDDYPDPENINLSSLMSRMRQIRSSGQIQYRIPKKRRREDEPRVKEDDTDDLETITIQRQKRIKKKPRGPRSDREKKKVNKEARKWLSRPSCHPPMVLETMSECHPPMVLETMSECHPPMVLETMSECHPPMVLDDS